VALRHHRSYASGSQDPNRTDLIEIGEDRPGATAP
jgi:hypothetical protein